MNSKKCVFCNSINVKKDGTQNGVQRWKCKDCNKKFQANKKSLPKEEIFCSFVFHKQTLDLFGNNSPDTLLPLCNTFTLRS